ncbi:uncharacterized protein AMSG_06988 [Thecamonas trahens ATCC 50062]|uniref:DEP domain-containing protein n=1 Tax=Thecamonas trahens ATCC 50062 TaxID=461836 RepID=A0A0L0DFE6_THETB|nr:hypothetical protein AMSG_06988 [Thecamonas trahens ATCC 50062]KNC51014.1 hypothetical protein AMSG_06988 [Thecamonas trahens ATCC 50062]|eukprot:XP_013756482.1 hypothetical protein AMSG_06988 [Thecamonas trahens ATCC 50062]
MDSLFLELLQPREPLPPSLHGSVPSRLTLARLVVRVATSAWTAPCGTVPETSLRATLEHAASHLPQALVAVDLLAPAEGVVADLAALLVTPLRPDSPRTAWVHIALASLLASAAACAETCLEAARPRAAQGFLSLVERYAGYADRTPEVVALEAGVQKRLGDIEIALFDTPQDTPGARDEPLFPRLEQLRANSPFEALPPLPAYTRIAIRYAEAERQATEHAAQRRHQVALLRNAGMFELFHTDAFDVGLWPARLHRARQNVGELTLAAAADELLALAERTYLAQAFDLAVAFGALAFEAGMGGDDACWGHAFRAHELLAAAVRAALDPSSFRLQYSESLPPLELPWAEAREGLAASRESVADAPWLDPSIHATQLLDVHLQTSDHRVELFRALIADALASFAILHGVCEATPWFEEAVRSRLTGASAEVSAVSSAKTAAVPESVGAPQHEVEAEAEVSARIEAELKAEYLTELEAWFEVFVTALELKVIALGETSPNANSERWSRGFCFDDGGNTPLVKDPKLIQTPEGMVSLLWPPGSYVPDLMLVGALPDAGFLFGDVDLYDEFHTRMRALLATPHPTLRGTLGQVYGAVLLKEALGEGFKPKFLSSATPLLDVKQSMYRFCSLVVSGMVRLFARVITTSNARRPAYISHRVRVRSLVADRALDAIIGRALLMGIALAAHLRNKAQALAGTEANVVYASEDAVPAGTRGYVVPPGAVETLARVYHAHVEPAWQAAVDFHDQLLELGIGQVASGALHEVAWESGGGDDTGLQVSAPVRFQLALSDTSRFAEAQAEHVLDHVSERSELGTLLHALSHTLLSISTAEPPRAVGGGGRRAEASAAVHVSTWPLESSGGNGPPVVVEHGVAAWWTAVLAFSRSIDIRSRRYRLRVYRECFVGNEAVRLLKATFPDVNTTGQALAVGNTMMREGVFSHVVDKKQVFRDGHFFYRFSKDLDLAAIAAKARREERDSHSSHRTSTGLDAALLQQLSPLIAWIVDADHTPWQLLTSAGHEPAAAVESPNVLDSVVVSGLWGHVAALDAWYQALVTSKAFPSGTAALKEKLCTVCRALAAHFTVAAESMGEVVATLRTQPGESVEAQAAMAVARDAVQPHVVVHGVTSGVRVLRAGGDQTLVEAAVQGKLALKPIQASPGFTYAMQLFIPLTIAGGAALDERVLADLVKVQPRHNAMRMSPSRAQASDLFHVFAKYPGEESLRAVLEARPHGDDVLSTSWLPWQYTTAFLRTTLMQPSSASADAYKVRYMKRADGSKVPIALPVAHSNLFAADAFGWAASLGQRRTLSIALCFDQMLAPMDEEAMKAFMDRRPQTVISMWLAAMDRYNRRIEAMFTLSELDDLFAGGDGSLLPFFVPADLVQNLYDRYVHMQALLASAVDAGAPLTHLELLLAIDPDIGAMYREVLESAPGPLARYAAAEKRMAAAAAAVRVRANSTSPRGAPASAWGKSRLSSVSAFVADGRMEPQAVLGSLQFDSAESSQMALAGARDSLVYGNGSEFAALGELGAKENVVRLVPFANLSPGEQVRVLENVRDTPFRLAAILEHTPHLELLDVSFSSGLVSPTGSLTEMPKLHTLVLRGVTTLAALEQRSRRSRYLPALARLDVRGCGALKMLDIPKFPLSIRIDPSGLANMERVRVAGVEWTLAVCLVINTLNNTQADTLQLEDVSGVSAAEVQSLVGVVSKSQFVNALMLNRVSFAGGAGNLIPQLMRSANALKCVTISGCRGVELAAVVAAATESAHLRQLTLSEFDFAAGGGALVRQFDAMLQARSSLRALTLRGCGLNGCSRVLAALGRVLNRRGGGLSSLDLSDNGISGLGLAEVISGLLGGGEASAMGALGMMLGSAMSRVGVGGRKVSGGGNSGAVHGTSLTTLVLDGNALGGRDLGALGGALAANCSLTALSLSRNPIGEHMASFARGLSGNTRLTTLELDSAQLGDAGALALATALAGNRALRWLSLQANRISADAGAEVVAALVFVTHLNLAFNGWGEEEMFEALAVVAARVSSAGAESDDDDVSEASDPVSEGETGSSSSAQAPSSDRKRTVFVGESAVVELPWGVAQQKPAKSSSQKE